MAQTRATKEIQLNKLKEELKLSQSVILLDYKGITVKEADGIRAKCRESNVRYRVVKNTLARLAAEAGGLTALGKEFTGTTAIAYSVDDPVAPAKVLSEITRENEKIKLKVGFLAGKLLSESEIKRLAALPGKNEIRAQLLGLLTAPARNLVSVMAGVPRSMVTVLKAKADKGN
ncbi:MAG: 50S ribosomal protein L10 [Myxococcota bacterium]